MRTPKWIRRTLESLDDGDAAGFCEYLAEDSSFIFANNDPVDGRDAIHTFVEGFIDSLQTTNHSIDETFQVPGRTVVRGEVEYVRHDGSTLEVPFTNIFETDDGEIEVYQVYVDNSAL